MKQKIVVMKKLYFVLFIIFASLQTNAQVDSNQLALDNIFQYVDKSQVPTGFLEEHSAQFVNLKTFNGVLTDRNTVNAMAKGDAPQPAYTFNSPNININEMRQIIMMWPATMLAKSRMIRAKGLMNTLRNSTGTNINFTPKGTPGGLKIWPQ